LRQGEQRRALQHFLDLEHVDAKKLTAAKPEQQQGQPVMAGQARALVDAVEQILAHAAGVGSRATILSSDRNDRFRRWVTGSGLRTDAAPCRRGVALRSVGAASRSGPAQRAGRSRGRAAVPRKPSAFTLPRLARKTSMSCLPRPPAVSARLTRSVGSALQCQWLLGSSGFPLLMIEAATGRGRGPFRAGGCG